MILERSLLEGFLTNTYLIADKPGGTSVLIDAGGPMAELLAKIESEDLTLTHILLTHHHHDHVVALDEVRRAHPEAKVLAHPIEEIEGAEPLEPGETVTAGGLTIETLHTPGHTAGMLNFLVDGTVFTGDTLFKGSVGGVRGPGHTTYEDLKRSIMEVLLSLPPETDVRPGHTDPTTVADELEHNPFVRIWRGVDPEGTEPCRAMGEEATLILFAPDYDGGHKAWVRWPNGADDIVPGSQIQQ